MKFAKGFVELLTRVRVFGRQLQTSLGRAGAARAERGPAKIEHGQRDLQTFAHRAENIFLWDFDLAERETSGGGAADSHLRHARFEYFEARHVRRNQKCRDHGFI